ncbi:hypothetical protein LOTGIDRAFT_215123 [Lottia gigantea]|uniref:Suppressor APC domain-containing protein n=1 Tax=Lottia gigantea TaxID=225164 RepID=V4C0J7_LOTGI|nr:hypothetical protein LOTGIDRAFT_215123 [Lottia gigantea]ESO94964.1 hypothetical protein LOTGIDRAFT_215123 [Lottia gigantea]
MMEDAVTSNFISSLRVLFEILDEKRAGYVRFSDIELRWNEEGVRGLPYGVLDALRKVVPPNGCLTFEQFVSGLKLALVTSAKQKEKGPPPSYNKDKEKIYDRAGYQVTKQYGDEIPYYKATYVRTGPPVTVAVKPNNALNTNRRSGSSQHLNERKGEDNSSAPARPPRPAAYRKEPVRRAPVQRKNSGRRHTLTSGVDHNLVIRLQQLDEEKNLLLQGQKVVDETKEWYRKQLSQIQEKQKYAGKVMFNNNSLEAHREKINFLKARIFEVNQNLKTLIESSEKGFPLHMNLALGLTFATNTKDNGIQMVREQNKLLTNEVSTKDKKISVLEREKSSLIRELFEARSGGKTNYDDTTFM